ncbi:hypothetical protein ACIQ9Q_39830 [Streptomyces sp. NPDC094438]|uniref:hypothetical protein n=1 Tax=Streptomyces sp. NPDC094438 TaxID=3366061 RepID=UPI00380CE4AF
METILLIAAILVMTGIGVRLIHLLNAQHDARIASYHFGDALPGVGRRSRKHHRRTPGASRQPAGTASHADRKDTGR